MRIKRFVLQWCCGILLLFSACQKNNTVGNKDYKTLGSSARDLLSASSYVLLQIEISYMPGYAPDSNSIINLVNFLNPLINKPAGIQVIQKEIPASGIPVLTLGDIVSIEKKHRSIFTGNDIMGIHILITDGHYAGANTFGKAYWNTSICIFGKTINDNSGGIGQVSKTRLFSTIAQHEFGHIMGLVGQGSAMQVPHRDGANGAHCTNKSCLMYYGIETIAPSGLLGGIPSLDQNCLIDLKANGGK